MQRIFILLGIALLGGCAGNNKAPEKQGAADRDSLNKMVLIPAGSFYMGADDTTGTFLLRITTAGGANLDVQLTVAAADSSASPSPSTSPSPTA